MQRLSKRSQHSTPEKGKAGVPGGDNRPFRELSVLIQSINDFGNLPQTSECSDPVKIVIYFDEAHQLAAHESRQLNSLDRRSVYETLCSSLVELRQLPLFVIFLSTTSSISLLAPPARYQRSSRARMAHGLHPPITETPFDCHPELPIELRNVTIDSLSTLSFMARFGRPL